jgi:hypothetical protein
VFGSVHRRFCLKLICCRLHSLDVK